MSYDLVLFARSLATRFVTSDEKRCEFLTRNLLMRLIPLGVYAIRLGSTLRFPQPPETGCGHPCKLLARAGGADLQNAKHKIPV